MIRSATHAHISLFICPPPAAEFFPDFASSTTTFHHARAQANGSISHRIRDTPSCSRNHCLLSARLFVAGHVYRRCRLISRWPPSHLPRLVDDESPVRNGAVVHVHFLQTAISFIVQCVEFFLCALSSLFYLDITGAGANVIQHFCKTLSHVKLARTSRILAFALVAFCIVSSPLCANSQVFNCDTFELPMR